MKRRVHPAVHMISAVFVLLLLAACGAAPSSSSEAPVATEDVGTPSDTDQATSPADQAGSNSAGFDVDGDVHAFSSNEGGMYRNAMVDAPDVEMVTFEAYTVANDLYAKVDVNVPKGRDPEGEYVAGNLSTPEHRNVPGHGQVTLAVEKDPVAGRSMYPSGSGRITVKREGKHYRAEFEVGGDGVFRAADAPLITGHVQVDALSQ